MINYRSQYFVEEQDWGGMFN